MITVKRKILQQRVEKTTKAVDGVERYERSVLSGAGMTNKKCNWNAGMALAMAFYLMLSLNRRLIHSIYFHLPVLMYVIQTLFVLEIQILFIGIIS